VVAFYTWGSRPRLYDVAPSGLDAWAAVAHAGLLLPFGARSVRIVGCCNATTHRQPRRGGIPTSRWEILLRPAAVAEGRGAGADVQTPG
jgi:hypothetical protein